jgi:hypothetical protein
MTIENEKNESRKSKTRTRDSLSRNQIPEKADHINSTPRRIASMQALSLHWRGDRKSENRWRTSKQRSAHLYPSHHVKRGAMHFVTSPTEISQAQMRILTSAKEQKTDDYQIRRLG